MFPFLETQLGKFLYNQSLMMQTLTVTDTLKSLKDVETAFNLHPNTNLDFFPEWQDNLPDLTETEKNALDRIKASYLYNSVEGGLTEATINLLLVSPLLYLAGYCDPPFKIRAEKNVEIVIEEENKRYRGRIDILVLKNKLWLAVIESKQTQFSFSIAIPQALAYMVGHPEQDKPIYGLVTNGDSFLFIKLYQNNYSFSTDYSIYGLPENELYRVLQVMKKL